MSFQVIDAQESPLTDEAIWMLAEIETHPKVMEWDVDIHTKDQREMFLLFKAFFQKLPNDKDQIFLVGKLDGRTIGFLGIHRKSKRMKHVGVVGIIVHPDYWRRGFGTKLLKAGIECAKREGFVRLEADILAKNDAMRRIAEKHGFKLEGIRKMRIRINKRYEDEALLALLLK